ncbi:MAG: hypothetical protein WCI72_02700 [archaeon]
MKINFEGLIFNIFEHSFDENCPLAAVNVSHFLPCNFFSNSNENLFVRNKFSKNIAKWQMN